MKIVKMKTTLVLICLVLTTCAVYAQPESPAYSVQPYTIYADNFQGGWPCCGSADEPTAKEASYERIGKRLMARRSDGSTVFLIGDDSIGWHMSELKLFRQGIFAQTSYGPIKHTIITKRDPVPTGREINPACGVGKLAGSILGVPVVIASDVSRLLPTGSTRHVTVWAAPSLGCVVLRQLDEETSASGRKGVVEFKASKIDLGPPDSALFKLPGPEFERLGPVEAYSKTMKKVGQPVDPQVIKSLQHAEDDYQAHRYVER